MLVADAAKMVHDQRKKDPNKEKADVRGVIGMFSFDPSLWFWLMRS
jgi:hypothetical protein